MFRLLFAALLALPASAGFDFRFDSAERRWSLSNGALETVIQLTPAGELELEAMTPAQGNAWIPAPGSSSLIRLKAGDVAYRGSSSYRLLSQSSRPAARGSFMQTILLGCPAGDCEITLEFQMWPDLPVLRYGARYRNTGSEAIVITEADMAPWTFDAAYRRFTAMRVEQWLPLATNPATFRTLVGVVDASGVTAESGAHGRHCAWLAISGDDNQGLALGLEFDGRARMSASHAAGDRSLRLSATVDELYRRLEVGEEFQIPRAFLAFYQGAWDDAAAVTHRFVETALAKELPSGVTFPFVTWDSWAYGAAIDEKTLRRNAEIAARMGMETFVVDLGWARGIGDWYEDRSKFPSGLRALSDYVHSLGMKFGLHIAWAEVDSSAPVLDENPDWTSTNSGSYLGAESLCLAHRPAREWIVQQIIRVIDDYNVDWILQDGENMVKECRKTSHTHESLDSNSAGAEGLAIALEQVQKARPRVMWENCENGGNLMTFSMVQHYVTSIVNDASGARGSRQGVYGSTFPFPARYADRYMPEQLLDPYVTRSYMFGGPWVFMNRLADFSGGEFDFASSEVGRFKSTRDIVRGGKILHLTGAPGAGVTDAIAAYNDTLDSAVAVVTRDESSSPTYRLILGELVPGRSYQVTFATDPRVLTVTGDQMRTTGIDVFLPLEKMAELVTFRPMR
ncbi:MAG: glycoside hydrolase family 36 protein [Bryobacteraceae bacterium]